MFSPLLKGIGLAASPAGRKAIRGAIRFARSEQGHKVAGQAKKVATSPEARKLVGQTVRAAKRVSATAKTPENQQRIQAAARLLRQRAARGGK